MATTEGPGGPHRGHAGELTNSTVNGSTSDEPVETHNAGLACRGYPGKRGVSRSGPGQKGHKLDFSGGINEILRWKKDRREKIDRKKLVGISV